MVHSIRGMVFPSPRMRAGFDMSEGLLNVAALLKHSDSMLVCWDTTYAHRLQGVQHMWETFQWGPQVHMGIPNVHANMSRVGGLSRLDIQSAADLAQRESFTGDYTEIM